MDSRLKKYIIENEHLIRDLTKMEEERNKLKVLLNRNDKTIKSMDDKITLLRDKNRILTRENYLLRNPNLPR